VITSSPLELSTQELRRSPFERRAAVATHRADTLVNLALAATFDPDCEQTAFFTHHHRSLNRRLSDFARKHLAIRGRTVHIEPRPVDRGLRRDVLPAIKEVCLRRQ
jgi:hypothetical protein